MMKKFLLSALFTLAMTATAGAKSVVFVLNDSTKVYYQIAGGNPVIKIQEKGFSVNNQDSYRFETFNRFFISEDDSDPSGIAPLLTRNLLFENGSLVVESEATARLYSSDGRSVSVATKRADGKTVFDLSSLPRGTYVLRYGNTSIKFMKK